METVIPGISQNGLSEQIYERLRDAIVDGVFIPGERVSAQELAAHFQVSTTPIRDALKRLEADSLVEISPRRGTFIVQFSRQTVSEVFQIREIIECAAAERIAEVTEETVQKMRGIVEEMEGLRDGETFRDYSRYIKCDAQFHSTLVAVMGNKRLLEVYEGLRWPSQAVRGLSHAHDQRAEEGMAEHNEIVQALAERDTVRAKAAVLNHLQRACEDILRRIPQ